jgi:hypothetical protein
VLLLASSVLAEGATGATMEGHNLLASSALVEEAS